MKHQKTYRIKTLPTVILLLIALLLLPAIPTQAASKKNVWVHTANYYFYKDKNGKKVTGFKKIGKEYYNFDSKGHQLTGWRKIGKNYRFFTIANGAKGKMVRSKVVNGIQINAKGVAVITKTNTKKLSLLVSYRNLADEITRPTQSLSQRKRICYDYIKNFPEHAVSESLSRMADWDQQYAEFALTHRYGDCFTRGCAFAYLANAVGVKKVKSVSNGGHGWTEINGKIYDPSFEHHYPSNNYYALTYKQAPQYNNKRLEVEV